MALTPLRCALYASMCKNMKLVIYASLRKPINYKFCFKKAGEETKTHLILTFFLIFWYFIKKILRALSYFLLIISYYLKISRDLKVYWFLINDMINITLLYTLSDTQSEHLAEYSASSAGKGFGMWKCYFADRFHAGEVYSDIYSMFPSKGTSCFL